MEAFIKSEVEATGIRTPGEPIRNPVFYHCSSGLDSAYQLPKKIDQRAT